MLSEKYLGKSSKLRAISEKNTSNLAATINYLRPWRRRCISLRRLL